MSQRRIIALIGLLGLLLSACAAAPQTLEITTTPTNTPTATAIPPTPTLPDATVPPEVRRTLPPTFTPTFTPSITPIPSSTLPPTITPTPLPPDEFTLCNSFAFDVGLRDGEILPASNTMIIQGFLQYTSVQINFVAVHDESGESVEVTRQGGGRLGILAYGASFPVTGRYDWVVTLSDNERSGLCERSGFFFVDLTEIQPLIETATAEANTTPPFDRTLEAALSILETATASAEVTLEPEATAEVTEEVETTPTPPEDEDV